MEVSIKWFHKRTIALERVNTSFFYEKLQIRFFLQILQTQNRKIIFVANFVKIYLKNVSLQILVLKKRTSQSSSLIIEEVSWQHWC